MGKSNHKKNSDEIIHAGVAGASYQTVQTYGSAAKQHYVAYSGIDNEAGKTLAKGLKQISGEKVNPEYKFQNIHEQAGFSAEVKDVARTNAENIINGDSARKVRTDDLGRVNDPIYDTVLVDENGNVIEGSGAQMKFIGASSSDPTGENAAKRALAKLQSKKFEKYLDSDAKIDVPSDQYGKIIEEADSRINNLTKQLDNQKEAGNSDQVAKLEAQIKKLNKIKKNLRKSTLTSEEAVFARVHPKLSTAVDVAKLSHRAGMKSAESAAIIGGSVSIIRNLVELCKEEKEPEEAIRDVIKDTASTAVVGYGTGVAGTAIKGAMQNAKSEYFRAISKTNIAGTVAVVAVDATKTLVKYFSGEINGLECFETLGEQGTGMVASAMFAAVGQVAIPIPVIGGMIGGMMGYALSSATYRVLLESLKDAELAKEEREQIEKACEEHIAMLRQYRAELEEVMNKYLVNTSESFRSCFTGIKKALDIGDVDLVISYANSITENLGGKPAFATMEEFDQKMQKEEVIKL